MTVNYAFIDINNEVQQIAVFAKYDIELLEQIKEQFNCVQYIESTEENPACFPGYYIDGQWIPKENQNKYQE